ncbi:MAG: hypothetical protein PV362_09870, partial [Providencia heimbachae]|nr:hypothetical protein [Providencia heimbachae]
TSAVNFRIKKLYGKREQLVHANRLKLLIGSHTNDKKVRNSSPNPILPEEEYDAKTTDNYIVVHEKNSQQMPEPRRTENEEAQSDDEQMQTQDGSLGHPETIDELMRESRPRTRQQGPVEDQPWILPTRQRAQN